MISYDIQWSELANQVHIINNHFTERKAEREAQGRSEEGCGWGKTYNVTIPNEMIPPALFSKTMINCEFSAMWQEEHNFQQPTVWISIFKRTTSSASNEDSAASDEEKQRIGDLCVPIFQSYGLNVSFIDKYK